MCGPAALPIAAAVLAAGSAVVGGVSAKQQADVQSKVANNNAALERNAAQQDIENTKQSALDHYRKIGQLKGQQRARAAAAGVGADFGTAAQVVDDTDMLGREDVNRIYQQGYQDLKGHDISASNYTSQASAAKTAGTMALVKSGFDAGSSLLTAAKQYSDNNGGNAKKSQYTSYPSFGNG